MASSLLRIVGGILAGIAVIAVLWAIAWDHPQFACGLMLGGFGAGWGWFLFRSVKTGSVMVRGSHYLRAKSPAAYWGWLGFFIFVGLYLLLGGSYALITSR